MTDVKWWNSQRLTFIYVYFIRITRTARHKPRLRGSLRQNFPTGETMQGTQVTVAFVDHILYGRGRDKYSPSLFSPIGLWSIKLSLPSIIQ